nr:hypothetical protein [Tanacetum cinerariifolium]
KSVLFERDDIINIVSLKKHSSRDTHFNPLKSKPKRQNQFGLPPGNADVNCYPTQFYSKSERKIDRVIDSPYREVLDDQTT